MMKIHRKRLIIGAVSIALVVSALLMLLPQGVSVDFEGRLSISWRTQVVLAESSVFFYPDADPESSSVDSRIYRNAPSGESWSSIRSNDGTTAWPSDGLLMVGYSSYPTDELWYTLYRSIIVFDTQLLPDDATVTSAVLSIYGHEKWDDIGISPSINVYSASPASNTDIVAGDYDTLGTTAFCDTPITYSVWSDSSYNSFSLNASGLAAITTGVGGSKFGLREASYDAPNVAPDWEGGYESTLTAYSADYGESTRPRLEVHYTYEEVVYTPSGNSGGWTDPAYAYSSNGYYATRDPIDSVDTNSPTADTGSAWTNPARAYDSNGTGYADITAGNPSGSNVWGDYGFVLSGMTVYQVRIRYDAWSGGVASPVNTGVKYPATVGTTQESGDDNNWTSPSNVGADDTTYASITAQTFDSPDTSYLMRATNFSSGVPSGATISGIVVEIERYSTSTGEEAGDYDVCLTKDGTTRVGDDKSGGDVYDTAPEKVTFGGVSDLWNTTWSQAEVTASTFGVLYKARAVDSNAEAFVDYIRVIIYYTPSEYDDQIKVDVSWDGGGSWSSTQDTTLTSSEATYWYDVTGVTAWTPTKLADGQLQVRALAQTVNNAETLRLDWIPVEVAYYDASNLDHTYIDYGISVSGEVMQVEVGIEAYAVSDEMLSLKVTWDGGSTWSDTQTSSALGDLDPNSVTWFDFTSATTWDATKLNNSNFKVYVLWTANGAWGQISLDYIPVRINYIPGGADISINYSSIAFGVVSESTTYWSFGSEPSWVLTDSDAYFTVTNSGDPCSITIQATSFTGGVGWTLTDGSPGQNTVRLTAFKEGDDYDEGVILDGDPQAFISGLVTDVDWELKMETGTFTDGAGKEATVTLAATLD